MGIKYENLSADLKNRLRSTLERICDPRQDDESFIRQRAEDSVKEYNRVVSIFQSEDVAHACAMGVLYDGLFNQD